MFYMEMIITELNSTSKRQSAVVDACAFDLTFSSHTCSLDLQTLSLNLSTPFVSSRYGFRNPPYMNLALKPCFGGKSLGKYESTVSSVMRQLEKRLKQEFMKVLVYPNMDDEVLAFMDHVPYALLPGSAATSSATTPSN